MQHERFRAGRLTTAFIDEEYPDGFSDTDPPAQLLNRFIVAAASLQSVNNSFYRAGKSRMLSVTGSDATSMVVRISRTNHPVVVKDNDGGFEVNLSGEQGDVQSTVITDWQPGQQTAAFVIDGRNCAFQIFKNASGFELWHGGYQLKAQVLSARKAELAALMLEKVPQDMSKYLLCPMPGLIVALNVQEGDKVEAGQPLAVVEAMKMENVLQAQKSGVVSKLPVSVGDSLQVDEVIMEFE